MKYIRFRRLNRKNWEIARDEDELHAKLDGEMAEVVMPAKPWYVRLWRRVRPLRAVECGPKHSFKDKCVTKCNLVTSFALAFALAIALLSFGVHAADPPAAATYRALDDKLYVLGTDNDFQITYDSGDNRVEIRDAAGNVLGRVSDAGTTGVVGFTQFDVINGSFASQITSAATANRAMVVPDRAGTFILNSDTGTVTSGMLLDGTILNADVNAGAAIVPTKFSAGTDGQVVVTAAGASGWGTVPSAGITDGTIVNADINASAAIAVTKLATTGASSGYVLTYNGSAIVWSANATGTIGGTGPLVDNAIPRMDGTGGATLQGYNSAGVTITASDDGLLYVPGGIDVDDAIIQLNNGTLSLDDQSYLKYLRGAESRWEVSYTAGAESGTSGETSLQFIAYDNDGNNLRDVMLLNRTATEGVVFGSNATPSPIYVKGDIYAHTSDSQIVDDGKVLLTALAQTSASAGQAIVWNGSAWAPASTAVDWGSPGTIGSSTPNTGAFTSLNAASLILSSSGKMNDNATFSWGTDNDIVSFYNTSTSRLDFTDGANFLAYLSDAGSEGNWTVTGDTFFQDNDFAVFGDDSDFKLTYDETTDDRLEYSDGTNLLGWRTDAGTWGRLGANGVIEARRSVSTISVTSITRSGQTATVTTASNHGLSTGDFGNITGAVETQYNGAFRITRTGATTFTYTVDGSPTTPATGTIVFKPLVQLFFNDDGNSAPLNIVCNGDVSYLNPGSTTAAHIITNREAGHLIFDLYGNDARDSISFRTNSSAGNVDAIDTILMTLNCNNRVGILQSNPQYALDVNGTGRIAGAFQTDGGTTIGDAAADTLHVNANTIAFEGATPDANETIFAFTDPTGDRTVTFQNASGTVAYLADLSGGAATKSVAFTDATEVGNVGGGQDDLISETLTAGALGDTKDALEIDAMVYVKGGTTCIAAIYFGSTAIYTNTFAPAGDTRYPLHGRVIRTGAATQIAFGWNDNPDDATDTMEYTTPAETLSGAITVKVTGQSTIGAADNDIKATWMAGTVANTP